MKQVILITGAGPNGVTGRLIKERLQDDYIILSPSSKELDLTDDKQVREYFDGHDIDYIIHCALYRAQANETFSQLNDDLEKNLRMFYSLTSQSHRVKKMIYFGSGAEYDKSREIINVSEDKDFNQSIPFNVYGFSKYIMNQYAVKSRNIYNFRLFGTINPYEPYTKNVLSNICAKAIKGCQIELNQDCLFSWIDIDDVITFIRYALIHELTYHDYNLVQSQKYRISEMANMIVEINKRNLPITFKKDGLNLEYTASNQRWLNEYDFQLTPVRKSLEKVYTHLIEISKSIDMEQIDSRWNNCSVNICERRGGVSNPSLISRAA